MSDRQFEGKSAIVTGGTRGIGKAIVLELARRGANVAFNYSKSADEAEKLKAIVETILPLSDATRGQADAKTVRDLILERLSS